MPKVSQRKLIEIKDLPSFGAVHFKIKKLSRKEEKEIQAKYPKWNEQGEDQTDYMNEKILNTIVSWDLTDDNDNVLPINTDNFSYLTDEDVTYIFSIITGFTVEEMKEMAKKKVLNSTS